MGQKVHPTGVRVGIIKDWNAKWYADSKNFADYLVEDQKIRKFLKKKLYLAGISKIEIERTAKAIKVNLYTAKPGIVIGKGGAGVETVKNELAKLIGKDVNLNIVEVKNIDLDAQLVAENIAGQLERRISFRRAMKQCMQKSMKAGALGIKTAVSGNQIEAARIAMTRYIKRGGKVWIKIFPDKPITAKPIGTRMGKGKGAPEYWVAVVKPGRVMFEIAGVPEETAREALRLAMNKLPIKTKFIAKETEKVGENDEDK